MAAATRGKSARPPLKGKQQRERESKTCLVNGRGHKGEEREAAVLDGRGQAVGHADAVLGDGEGDGGPEHGGEGAGVCGGGSVVGGGGGGWVTLTQRRLLRACPWLLHLFLY